MKPGLNGKAGLNALKATSIPETKDCLRKWKASAANELSLGLTENEGNSRELTHAAAKAETSPRGQSLEGPAEIASQNNSKPNILPTKRETLKNLSPAIQIDASSFEPSKKPWP